MHVTRMRNVRNECQIYALKWKTLRVYYNDYELYESFLCSCTFQLMKVDKLKKILL